MTPELVAAWVSPRAEAVRVAPRGDAALRGFTQPGEPFRGGAMVEGPGCDAGWLTVDAGGFVCSTRLGPAEAKPRSQPTLVPFDPPEPAEYDAYVASGTYERGAPEALLPAIYGKRFRRFSGRLYESVDALVAGEPPVSSLEAGAGMKYHFHHLVETTAGPVLVREDGRAARLDDIYLYPVSRLRGVDLEVEPLGAGELPGITVAYDGAEVRDAPGGAVVDTLPYHSVVTLGAPEGPWWPLADGAGWLREADVRHPLPSPSRPAGVGDDELWIDVELSQQALMLRRGDALVYFTVASTGAAPMGTPRGTFGLVAKHALKDMQSREGAADRYHVEDVPWALYFLPTYAVHAAYWHWGFGRPASHGCVNLAPADARALFERLGPPLPEGWRSIYPVAADPEVVVRVRRGDDVGRDRR